MPASLRELLDAIEFVSLEGGISEKEVVLCGETGRIYYRTDAGDEMPDDVDDHPERYIPIPSKRDLDLGQRLIFDFAREVLPDDFDEVQDIFSRRGAYRNFRALLTREKALDRWHDFESKATERALREWCESHSIAVEG